MVAAGVTTCAYATSFVITVFLYRRIVGLEWKHFVRPPALEETLDEAETV
jgi:hypothetical protein